MFYVVTIACILFAIGSVHVLFKLFFYWRKKLFLETISVAGVLGNLLEDEINYLMTIYQMFCARAQVLNEKQGQTFASCFDISFLFRALVKL